MLVLSLVRSWLDRRSQRRRSRSLRRWPKPLSHGHRPNLERLEDRVTPSGSTGALGSGSLSILGTIGAHNTGGQTSPQPLNNTLSSLGILMAPLTVTIGQGGGGSTG